MTAGTPRYLVERGADDLRTAFTAAIKICQDKALTSAVLVVPQKGGWDNSVVAEFLGKTATKALMKDQAVPLTTGVSMSMVSQRTFPRYVPQGLVIGAHISFDAMESIDDGCDAKAILYMPWNEKEGVEWLATWQATVIGPNNWSVPSSTLTAPVEAALSSLTQNINLSTGLGHPSDKASAVRTIGNLRAAGQHFDPREIRRWARRHGWSSKAASDLEALASK
jgi:hypothetical protein